MCVTELEEQVGASLALLLGLEHLIFNPSLDNPAKFIKVQHLLISERLRFSPERDSEKKEGLWLKILPFLSGSPQASTLQLDVNIMSILGVQ